MFGFSAIVAGALVASISLQFGLMIGGGGLTIYYIGRILSVTGSDLIEQQTLSIAAQDSSQNHSTTAMPTIYNTLFMIVFGGTILFSVIIQVVELHYGISIVILLTGVVGILGLVIAHYSIDTNSNIAEQQQPFSKVWDLVTSDPRLQLSFATAFYARADFIILTLFFSLWSISFADIVGVSRGYAIAHAGVHIGVVGFIMLLAMPFWNWFMKTHGRITAIGAALSIASIGFIMLGFIKSPFDWDVVIPLALLGIGHAGTVWAPKAVVLDLVDKELHGSVQGLFYLIGGAGVILLVQSGGYYFDAVGPNAPFLLMGTGNLLVMLYAAWLIAIGINESDDHTLKQAKKIDLKPLIFMFSLMPLIWLAGRVITSGYTPGTSIGEMPVGFINRYLGDWAFNFLVISLALRPLYELTGVTKLAQYRKMIGLYAFFYAVLHVIAYLWLEWVFKWNEIFADIVKRESVLLGIIAFIIMFALAATSTKKMIKRMGGKKWKILHKFNYLIGILVVIHFMAIAKSDNGEPYIYAVIVAVLLWYRYDEINRKKVNGVCSKCKQDKWYNCVFCSKVAPKRVVQNKKAK